MAAESRGETSSIYDKVWVLRSHNTTTPTPTPKSVFLKPYNLHWILTLSHTIVSIPSVALYLFNSFYSICVLSTALDNIMLPRYTNQLIIIGYYRY